MNEVMRLYCFLGFHEVYFKGFLCFEPELSMLI
jgi:hypothetical protein